MTKPVRIFKLEVLCMDLNNEFVNSPIPGERVAGLPFSKVMSVVEKQTVWDDEHPLNNKDTYRDAYAAIFGNTEDEKATDLPVTQNKDLFLGWTWQAHFNEVISLVNQKKWLQVARRLTSMLNHALERARE